MDLIKISKKTFLPITGISFHWNSECWKLTDIQSSPMTILCYEQLDFV
jgi:hypothetical protein